MLINKKSWHYKVVHSVWEPEMPNNLCTYFWNFWLACVFWVVIIPFAVGFFLCSSLFWLPDAIKRKVQKRRLEKQMGKIGQTESSNFLLEWARAKKHKACPLITYYIPNENSED